MRTSTVKVYLYNYVRFIHLKKGCSISMYKLEIKTSNADFGILTNRKAQTGNWTTIHQHLYIRQTNGRDRKSLRDLGGFDKIQFAVCPIISILNVA